MKTAMEISIQLVYNYIIVEIFHEKRDFLFEGPPIPIPMPNTTPSYLRLPSLFGRTTSSTPGSSGTATGCIWTAVDETVT